MCGLDTVLFENIRRTKADSTHTDLSSYPARSPEVNNGSFLTQNLGQIVSRRWYLGLNGAACLRTCVSPVSRFLHALATAFLDVLTRRCPFSVVVLLERGTLIGTPFVSLF